MTRHFTLEQMIEAIEGSGGITLTISQRLSCDWITAQRYIQKWETTKSAFAAEGEKILDVSESVVHRNIRLAYEQQTKTGKPVDAGDAKWVLSRKGKKRGYSDKQELELTGDQPIVFRVTREKPKVVDGETDNQ